MELPLLHHWMAQSIMLLVLMVYCAVLPSYLCLASSLLCAGLCDDTNRGLMTGGPRLETV
jgi:hypothetical protein